MAIVLGPPPYRGRFWQGDLRFLDVEEAAYYRATPEVPGGRKQFAPEIMIHASDRPTAQRAANLILAAASVEEGYQLLEELLALSEPGEPREDLDELEYESAMNSSMLRGGFAKACAMAAKASMRRHWTNALVNQFASLRAISVHPMDTHDPHCGIAFRVERDPFNHAFFAQAIMSSYMAIEAMGLEVPANREKPSKLNGEWNPPVLRDVENRLTSAGIDLEKKQRHR
jgi:hypothetical protein